jgi:hypothetical protein
LQYQPAIWLLIAITISVEVAAIKYIACTYCNGAGERRRSKSSDFSRGGYARVQSPSNFTAQNGPALRTIKFHYPSYYFHYLVDAFCIVDPGPVENSSYRNKLLNSKVIVQTISRDVQSGIG